MDPKVHGVLSWMGKLNEVDLAAVESQVDLYRDAWRMPLREDAEVDFDNRDAMFAECKTWEKPYVRVRKVDVKEGDAAAAAAAAADGESDGDADPTAAGSNPAGGAQVALTPAPRHGAPRRKVVSVEKHPDADKLYVEQVDCAEADGPRTICSGLVPYMSAEDILGKNVVVLANLKPRNMAGIKSAGMLLCANDGGDGDDRKVELLVAPEGAVAGERLTWGGAENDPAHGANKVAKKKMGGGAAGSRHGGELRGDVERDAAHVLRRRRRVRDAQGRRQLVRPLGRREGADDSRPCGEKV